MSDVKNEKMEKIVSLAKRRGFIYQGSEIYGGLSGTWDYGPLGVALKRNVMNLWWKMFVEDREDMYGVDAAILMNQEVWKASGHVDTFTDPLVECSKCKSRFRADKIDTGKCPSCGADNSFSEPRQFNMMFKTFVGPSATEEINNQDLLTEDGQSILTEDDESINIPQYKMIYDRESVSYLRPETAQGIFTNYKNIIDSFHPSIPFGIAQMGKAFRNEISPRDFIFRTREFEQMEIEYFIYSDNWEAAFEQWRQNVRDWIKAIGLPESSVHEAEVPADELAHYSKRTIDFEYDYPHGRDELLGLAYRTDFDLGNVAERSGKSMNYQPKDGGEAFIPHVIEPSFGVDRTILAILSNAYTEDEVAGEKRVFLKLPEHLAPVKYAVFPLLKNKPELVEKAKEVYKLLKEKQAGLPGLQSLGGVVWDDNGNIGKRYRRQDEIGTPHCITIDFQTLEDSTVTLRDRDTTDQKRINVKDL